MAKRFDDAIYIQAGACNPTAICKALQNAIDEAREERKTTAVGDDAAVRMILHQMCHLSQMNVDSPASMTQREYLESGKPYPGFIYEREYATCAVLASLGVQRVCGVRMRAEWQCIDQNGPTPAHVEAVKAARIAWDSEQDQRVD